MSGFGDYIRIARSARARSAGSGSDGRYSLQELARRVGVEPNYLSKVERGLLPPPAEPTIARLAAELGEDPDVLLTMAGTLTSGLQAVIERRPKEFAELIRQLKDAPERAILKVVRVVRDGNW